MSIQWVTVSQPLRPPSPDPLADMAADVNSEESVMALTEEVSGDDQASGLNTDGSHVTVPSWARKRIRSAASLSAPVDGSHSASDARLASS